jgi:DNA-binding LacI/PurR family transcriptional regulator
MHTETRRHTEKKGAVARHREVTEALRARILRGEYRPGLRLPTMHELAAQFDTSFFTIQTALGPLEAEGFLETRKRVGTIVKHNAAVLTTAAIYCVSTGPDAHHNAFRNELCHQLSRQLAGQDVHPEMFMDPRPQEQQHEPLPSLLRAIERNEVQALLVAGCDHFSLPWLRQLPTTASFVSSDCGMSNWVSCDSMQMLRLGLGRLRERGCRTVGLIFPIQNSPHLPPEAYERQLYRDCIEVLGDVGMSTRNAWMAVPDTWHANIEEYGYRQFRNMWGQTERPDGILVYPDVTARGVMTAALELGVRAPEDMHMVFHRNSGVAWFCPLSVDWVESDVAAWAAALIAQVRRQKAGEEIQEPTVLGYRLVCQEAGGQESGVCEGVFGCLGV